ncbi:uncharacterized protein LOC124357761 isoform X2 [Homalodisca vitripennis]|uniref:uncharacterized protein LOC124357761 isoform X2 n=1 Tax=Homalodisca vitripennis TaxID=197043 RepID=UPI001EEA3DB5|nr:uncharacterized protein LOC124357761 isoform X2 [Homalodisca vitripennis]KAG8284930.1 hypothetical protein J6590_091942 [Homalodisca vitripennis]
MFVLTVLLSLLQILQAETRWSCHRTLVEVTVSPLVNATSIRPLIVSWRTETVQPGDYVALYSTGSSEPLVTVPVTSPSGWVDTGLQENRSAWDTLAFTEQCLGYWVSLRRANSSQAVASSCLGTAPRWMERQREVIQNMSLRNMFLPGTHNSAAYLENHQPFRETFVQKYIFNQDERVLNQLIYGARVLDLRIGYYPSTPEIWWANHGVVRLRPLVQVLDDVKLFANMTEEIVVLDFHHFPVGFQSDSWLVHQALVKYVEDVMSGYLISPSLGWGAPLSSLWQSGRRIVLSYNYQGPLMGQYVWPRIIQKWGDVRSVIALHEYLAGVVNRPYPYPWAAMAELTPAAVDVITGRLGSLRQIAHNVNRNVTEWFRGDWGALCNIVSVDFLRSSGVVRAALDWNLWRARGTNCGS